MTTYQTNVVKILGVFVLCLLCASLFFNRARYGEVSGKTYEIATAIYSVCNLQDATKLANIDLLLQTVEADNSVTAEEADMLRGILQLAQAGHWKQATTEARRLMNDQVKYP